ncbi:three-helix bundle dimerization domain-containing protein [Mycobacterium sp. MMS18-G62]
MIELSEQTVIEQLVARLTSRYPSISEATVSAVVREAHSRYDGKPLRDFVPLLVERNARSELDRLGAMAG